MATKKSTTTGEPITVMALDTGAATCLIRGRTPLVFNRMAEKAKRELLLPRKKTRADREQTLKHEPILEFRNSVYRWVDNNHPTRLKFPSPAFKGALASAALEVPGMAKAQIGRLVWAEGTHVDVYGVPNLFMTPVRSAGMNKTPDIRTRALLPEWCCEVTLTFTRPTLTMQGIATLLAAAGLIIGVGDGRQEKGKLNFGQFELVDRGDKTFERIKATGGRDAQDAALEEGEPWDDESEELLTWYQEEIQRRGNEPEEEDDGEDEDLPEAAD